MDIQFKKMEALSKFLDDGEQHGILSTKVDDSLFEVGIDQEYLVLTDFEATERCNEYMKENLWSFDSSFIVSRLPFFDAMTHDASEAFEICLERLQNDLGESSNEFILSLLGENLNDFLKAAIKSGGRGHFLSTYDGLEHEQDEFFIYRVN